jgi:hypothetical protein
MALSSYWRTDETPTLHITGRCVQGREPGAHPDRPHDAYTPSKHTVDTGIYLFATNREKLSNHRRLTQSIQNMNALRIQKSKRKVAYFLIRYI